MLSFFIIGDVHVRCLKVDIKIICTRVNRMDTILIYDIFCFITEINLGADIRVN